MALPWLNRLRHSLSRLPRTGQAAIDRKLLDSETLSRIQAQATHSVGNLLRFDRPVAQMRIGDRLSRFRGQGFDFEENRHYQPGDEQRLINWRLYARRGELFSKVFIEERRPEVYILVDRRASMRFGTRQQLKVTLAAKLAIATLWQAQQQIIAVGGVVVNDQAQWFAPAQGQTGLTPLMEAINAPCPPLSFDREQESLQQLLAQLDLRLAEGSFLLLLSDFADLDPVQAAPTLQRLGQRHNVQAIQINDVAEIRLPEGQPWMIDDPASDQPFILDRHDQQAYQNAREQQQRALRDCLEQSGITCSRCETMQEWLACLQQTIYDSAYELRDG